MLRIFLSPPIKFGLKSEIFIILPSPEKLKNLRLEFDQPIEGQLKRTRCLEEQIIRDFAEHEVGEKCADLCGKTRCAPLEYCMPGNKFHIRNMFSNHSIHAMRRTFQELFNFMGPPKRLKSRIFQPKREIGATSGKRPSMPPQLAPQYGAPARTPSAPHPETQPQTSVS